MMITAARHIGMQFLAAAYLVTATMALLSLSRPVHFSNGPVAVRGIAGSTQEMPQQTFEQQRRHVLPVKCPTIPLQVANPEEAPRFIQERFIVHWHTFFIASHSYYYSSLCDRAPPLA